MLNAWQIYYDEKSKSNCFPEWKHYKNEKLTEHFENSVIVDLYEKGECKKEEYFGVFSHAFKKKMVLPMRGDIARPATIEKRIDGHDVYSFFSRRRQENIVYQAENYHTGFIALVDKILSETGFLPKTPKKLDCVVLFNYWIAKGDVYEAYIKELLLPAMEILENSPEAYKDARYKKIDDNTKARFIDSWGKPYYPYHPFILERLPSIFIQKHKLNYKHIF